MWEQFPKKNVSKIIILSGKLDVEKIEVRELFYVCVMLNLCDCSKLMRWSWALHNPTTLMILINIVLQWKPKPLYFWYLCIDSFNLNGLKVKG